MVGAQVGAKVPPPLDLVEMGLPADLLTTVVAVEPCPRLQAGDGRLVLTTVDHLNSDVWELTAVNSHGSAEHLCPTGLHKLYSETRRDWVSTKDIHDNEVIRGRAGPLTIVAKRSLPGTQRVYNLTVEGEHVFYVSRFSLLAHNNGCSVAVDANALVAAIERGESEALDLVIAGRVPIVSRQAVREFLVKGDKGALRDFLVQRGGRVASSGSESLVTQLQQEATALGRSLKPKDARVAASALTEGAPVITRDNRLRKFLDEVGIGGESF